MKLDRVVHCISLCLLAAALDDATVRTAQQILPTGHAMPSPQGSKRTSLVRKQQRPYSLPESDTSVGSSLIESVTSETISGIPKIDTYVINLDRRQDRCRCMAQQLASAPQAVYRQSALSESSCPELKDDVATLYGSRNHTAEKSLFCSNYKVWRRARSQEADFVVVMEDDTILKHGFWERIQRLVAECANFDYITVDSTPDADSHRVDVCNGYSKMLQPKNGYSQLWGTTVQVIRRGFLDTLIAQAHEHGMGPLDVWWMMRANTGRAFSWQPDISHSSGRSLAEDSATKQDLQKLHCSDSISHSDIAPHPSFLQTEPRLQCA